MAGLSCRLLFYYLEIQLSNPLPSPNPSLKKKISTSVTEHNTSPGASFIFHNFAFPPRFRANLLGFYKIYLRLVKKRTIMTVTLILSQKFMAREEREPQIYSKIFKKTRTLFCAYKRPPQPFCRN